MPRLSPSQVRVLLQVLDGTRDEEMTCDDCLPHLAVLVERELAGLPRSEAMSKLDQHLAICPECVEELNVLREAIRSLAKG